MIGLAHLCGCWDQGVTTMRRLDPSADVGVGWRSADASMYVDEKLVTWFSTCWCRKSVACATARASPVPVAVADTWSGLGLLVALALAARAAARASTTAAASAAPSAVAKMPPSLPKKKTFAETTSGHAKKTRMKVVAAALSHVALRPEVRGVLNVASGQSTSILQLAQTIRSITHSSSPITHSPARPADVRFSSASIERLRATGWSPKFLLPQGLPLLLEKK